MDELTGRAPPRSAAASDRTQEFSLDLAVRALLEPIREMLARIEARVETDSQARGVEGRSNATNALQPLAAKRAEDQPTLTDVIRRLDRLADTIADLCARIATPAPEFDSQDSAAILESSLAPTNGNEEWERIVLGEELSRDEELDAIRRKFLADVMGGVAAARAWAGQMLLIQAASVEELPELLRHVGEAYYRWRPRTSAADDPLETALARYLNRLADAAGLPNSIQLVRPGERFDGSRHITAGRGVEIVAVHGWVVLRDHNKVYTKANVSVR